MDERTRTLGKLTDDYVQMLFTSRLYSPIVVTTAGKLENSSSKDDDELFERLQKRLENEHYGTDYTALKGVVFDHLEIIRESRRNDYFSYGGMFGDQRIRHNVIWLNSDKSIEVRKRELDRYLDWRDDFANREPKKEEIHLPGITVMKDEWEPNLARFDYSDRCKGRSTRQADEYIQKFLDLKPGEYIEVLDHYECGNVGQANSFLCRTICGRLEKEYGLKFYVHRGNAPRIVKIEK